MRRVLLDECIDRRLAREIIGHQVFTSPEMGWAGLKNGDLLRNAEKDFDVFVTVDRNLAFQQHLPNFQIAVLVLHGRTNRLQDLLPMVPRILASLADPQRMIGSSGGDPIRKVPGSIQRQSCRTPL